MTLRVQVGGALRTITAMKVKQGGVVRNILSIKVMDGGTLRTIATFAPPITASASPSSVSGTQSSPGFIVVNTTSTTAMPVGGLPPYTYAWASLSGIGSPNSPTMATTNFGEVIGPGTESGSFRVTVTDSVGQTATATVSATFRNLGGGGGGEIPV